MAEQTSNSNANALPKYRLLGNSALRVFPLCLGTMHFGQYPPFFKHGGVGNTFEDAESIFLRYIEVGGNFIDTANFYHLGESEEYIGRIIAKNKIDREKLVIATKYSLPMSGDPNTAGNQKKNLKRSVRDSLKRLQTDYVDILYVHFWDWSVNIEDLMRDLDEVVKSGQVLHIAASDFPAWVVSSANSIAKQRGWTPFTAYQGRYNLTERDLEQEILPMTKHFNLATVPWSVLGAGKLTGTRTRENPTSTETARANVKMTENDYKIQDAVIEIAKELNRTPGQVALNWALHKTTTPLLGCRTLKQLNDNLGALEFDLTPEQIAKLDEVSKESPALIFPHNFIGSSTATNPFFHFPEKKYNFDL